MKVYIVIAYRRDTLQPLKGVAKVFLRKQQALDYCGMHPEESDYTCPVIIESAIEPVE